MAGTAAAANGTEREGRTGNTILRALSQASKERLAPHLIKTPMPHCKVVYKAGEPIHRVYFLDSGLVSLIQTMHDRKSVEVGATGVDCLTGANVLFGLREALLDTIVQMPGSAYAVVPDILREEAGRSARLSALLQGCVHLEVVQIAQTAARNRLHSLEQRCCRWLLTAHDSAAGDTFPLTQEFLAVMLGVQRPGVTIAARALQQAGYIGYSRGHITMLDRAGLEKAACECYATIRDQTDAMFAAAARIDA